MAEAKAEVSWQQTAQLSFLIVKMNAAKKTSVSVADFNPMTKKKDKAKLPVAPIEALYALLPN